MKSFSSISSSNQNATRFLILLLMGLLLSGNVLGQKTDTINETNIDVQDSQVLVHRSGSKMSISLELHEKKISDAITQLASESGIDISFKTNTIHDRKISLSLNGASLYEALQAILSDFDAEYELSNNGRVLVVHSLVEKEPIKTDDVNEGRGTLRGRVFDRTTGEALIGANVILAGTAIGASTNDQGEFFIQRLPAGNQVILIRYLGYVTKRVEVNIIAGESVTQDFNLVPDMVEGEEVIVYSQALGQAQAIRQQINSNTIVNVVSEARLRELPDANAAESLGRLPGISLIRDAGEGQRVAIRGLSPRYNAITFDGSRVPSTDDDGRAVDLNMISSEMLTGIEVYKAITPDMDADAIGGSVNFTFSEAPEGARLRTNLRSGYSGHINDIGQYNASVSGSNRFFNNMLGVNASLDFQRHDRSSDQFRASYNVLRDPRPEDGELYAPMTTNNLRLVDRLETRDRYGVGLMLDYRLGDGRITFNNFGSRLDRDIFSTQRDYQVETNRQRWIFGDTQSQTNVLSTRLGGEHPFNLNTGRLEFDWRVTRNVSEQAIGYDHQLDFLETGAFETGSLKQRMAPHEVPIGARNDFNETRFQGSNFRTGFNLEKDYSAQLDVTYWVNFGSLISNRFKMGGKYTQKERSRFRDHARIRDFHYRDIMDNEDRDWILNNQGHISFANYQDLDYRRDDFLDGQYIMHTRVNLDEMRNLWINHENQHRYSLAVRFGDQDVIERVAAAYVMTELNIGPRLMILPGVRYEHEYSDYTSYRGIVTGQYNDSGTINDTLATRNTGEWFPMVQARYKFTNNFDIRVARTVTVSRPNFTELIPRESRSADDQELDRGRTFLKPARAVNYDLFLSLYGNRIGLLSAGVFYKTITDLVYTRNIIALDPEAEDMPSYMRGWRLIEPFNNPNETLVRGFEIEWQSNLTFLPSPFSGVVVNVNFSRIWSETQYPEFILERRPGVGVVGIDTFRVAPMIHQPDYVGNASLGYDYRRFSGRVSMLYQGSTLRSVGNRIERDSFTDDYIRWDAQLRYRFIQSLDLIVNFTNLTNRHDGQTQFTGEFPTAQEYYGMSFDIGVRYNFF